MSNSNLFTAAALALRTEHLDDIPITEPSTQAHRDTDTDTFTTTALSQAEARCQRLEAELKHAREELLQSRRGFKRSKERANILEGLLKQALSGLDRVNEGMDEFKQRMDGVWEKSADSGLASDAVGEGVEQVEGLKGLGKVEPAKGSGVAWVESDEEH